MNFDILLLAPRYSGLLALHGELYPFYKGTGFILAPSPAFHFRYTSASWAFALACVHIPAYFYLGFFKRILSISSLAYAYLNSHVI